LVYDLELNELQQILKAVKHKRSGRKQSLRQRVLYVLKANTPKSKVVKKIIVQIYNSRSQQNKKPQQSQQTSVVQLPICLQQLRNNLKMHSQSYTPPRPNPIQPLVETSSPAIQFEHLPFFKTVQTLIEPKYCQTNDGEANNTWKFHLTDNIGRSIVKSWNIAGQEYKIQIILRTLHVGSNENVSQRLPYNIKVSVNDRYCTLPSINIPELEENNSPWRCNVPIDITQQTDLRNCLQNTLKITWSEEPYDFMVGVFVAHKFTSNDLLEELKKKPVRASDKTQKFIKESMENDGDIGVNWIFASIKDPITTLRMKLPARGIDCIHLKCFDAIQFLQMNELKQIWKCPLCKKKIKFENIEVDEFFLNILQCPNLSEECEGVFLLKDGSWSERKNREFSKNSRTNDSSFRKYKEKHTLSDSDDSMILIIDDADNSNSEIDNIVNDDIITKPKRFKYNPSKVEEFVIKSESVIKTEDLTNSPESDHVLDLSLKNNSTSSANFSSNDEPIVILDDDSNSSTSTLNNPISGSNNCVAGSSGSSRNNRHQEKDKSKSVLCVITLD